MTKVRKMKDQTEYQKESLNNAFRFLANLNPVLDCYVVGIDIGQMVVYLYLILQVGKQRHTL